MDKTIIIFDDHETTYCYSYELDRGGQASKLPSFGWACLRVDVLEMPR
jgi:hypothetical protein